MSTLDEKYVKQKVREHWDARAPMLDKALYHVAKSDTEDAAFDELFSRFLPAPPARVLDIGTGHGYLANVAARLGHEAFGIDISSEMIARSKERAEKLGLSIDFRVSDADTIPFEDASFDAITERNVLWTMPDPSRTLDEFFRVLKPGGRLIVIESKWLEKPTDPVTTAAGGAPNLDEHYKEFRADMPLMGGIEHEGMAELLGKHGFVEPELDWMEGVEAARLALHPEMTSDPARGKQYLIRVTKPGK